MKELSPYHKYIINVEKLLWKMYDMIILNAVAT